jgi:DNA replication protein DnaC
MTAEVELDGMLRRLHLPTVRRLWSDLQVRAEEEKMRYADYLQVLVGEEIAHRTQTRISRMTHRARFPFLRTIEEFDFAFQSGLRKELLGSYLGPEFVPEGRNLLLYGPSGTGKTHVAIAIAYKAIQHGSDARFVTAAHLIDELSSASRDGRLRETLVPYTHPGVLVVDEVGYLSYGPDAANVLFQVVNERTFIGDRWCSPRTSRWRSGEACCTTRIWRRRSWTGCWSAAGSSTSRARRSGPDTYGPRKGPQFREKKGQSFRNAHESTLSVFFLPLAHFPHC